MKKILILLLLPLFAVSCVSYSDNTEIKTVNLAVNESDWVEHVDADGTNRYYSTSFSMPEITSFVYNYGSVQVYAKSDNAQNILPYVRHYQDINNSLWTRTIDFDYSTGNIVIYVTYSDFVAELPKQMDFRAVIMWQK